MADPINGEALLATFAFGMVASAAAGTFLLQANRGASPLFRDGLRLVLAAFLFLSMLWSFLSFGATLINPTDPGGCQTLVAVASASDQIARIVLEEFLFFAMKSDISTNFGLLASQAVIFLRFVLGGVFVGVQRPQFDPVCVGTTLVLTLGVATLATDGVIVLILLIRASSVGIFTIIQTRNPGWRLARQLIIITAALVLWTMLSAPMLLGMPSFGLAIRTALPAGGLLLVVACTVGYDAHEKLGSLRKMPQDPSTNVYPDLGESILPYSRETVSRDLSTIDSSYPPGRGATARGFSTTMQNNVTLAPMASSQPIAAFTAAGTLNGAPQKTRQSRDVASIMKRISAKSSADELKKRELQMQPAKRAVIERGKIIISYPTLQDEETTMQSLQRIQTVDLATAVRNDEARRRMLKPSTSAADTTPRPSTNQRMMTSTSRRISKASFAPEVAKEARPRLPGGSGLELNLVRSTSKDAEVVPTLAMSTERQGPISPDNAPPSIPLNHQPRPTFSDNSPANTSAVEFSKPRETVRSLSPQAQLKALEDELISPVSPSRNDEILAGTIVSPLSAAFSKRGQNLLPKPVTTTTRPSVEILVPPVRPLSFPEDVSLITQDSAPLVKDNAAQEASMDLRRSKSVRTEIRPSRQRPLTLPNEAPVEQTPPEIPRSRLVRPLWQQPVIPPTEEGAEETLAGPLRSQSVRAGIHPTRQQSTTPPKEGPTEQLPLGIPRSQSVRLEIRPSRQQPVALAKGESTEQSKPTLAPFQLKGAAGLPSNPRSQAKTNVGTLESKLTGSPKGSVVHRPRPVPRRAEEDHASPPYSASSSHRRSIFGTTAPTESASASAQRPSSRLVPRPEPPRASPSTQVGVPGPQRASGYHAKTLSTSSKYVSKFSIDTSVSSTEDAYTSTTQSPTLTPSQISREGIRRRSSPVTTERVSSDSGAYIATGVQLKASTGSLGVLGPSQSVSSGSSIGVSEMATPSGDGASRSVLQKDVDRETVTFMLVHSVHETETEVKDSVTISPAGGFAGRRGSWHRRVGDDCPTFSDSRSRKSSRFLRPPPLPLHSVRTLQRDTTSQPSDLETPRKALDMIHEQLQKFEEPNQDPSGTATSRVALLMDLEMEMGEQESRWQRMRGDLSRASISTTTYEEENASNSPTHQDFTSAEKGNVNSSGSAEALSPAELYTASEVPISRADRPKQVNRGGSTVGNDDDVARSFEPLGRSASADNKAVVAEDNSAGSDHKASQVPVTSKLKLDELRDADMNTETPTTRPMNASELRQTENEMASETHSHAQAPQTYDAGSLEQYKPPTKSAKPLRDGIPGGLPANPHPRASKPPKRGRRMTALPDIVENPEPIQDNGGTLGIYQFPWGELSDTATIPIAMQSQVFRSTQTGVATEDAPAYPSLEAQVQQQIQKDRQALRSFFNYYDGEDGAEAGEGLGGLSDSSQDHDSSDDDSFDESTLWEIANLLNVTSVPSKNSLLPSLGSNQDFSLRTSVNEQWSDDQEFASSPPDKLQALVAPGTLRRQSSSPTLSTQDTLWINTAHVPVFGSSLGLPQPLAHVWSTYTKLQGQPARAASRRHTLITISSQELWSECQANSHHYSGEVHESRGLWAAQGLPRASTSSLSRVEIGQVSLWTPPSFQPKKSFGIVRQEPERWSMYTYTGPPMQLVRPRAHSNLTLESQTLWSGQERSQRSESDLVSSAAMVSQVSVLLWNLPTVQLKQRFGLIRHEPDNWNDYTDMEPPVRFVSARAHSTPTLESTELWTLQGLSMTPTSASTSRKRPSKPLWVPFPAAEPEMSYGMLRHEPEDWNQYTNMAPPVRQASTRAHKNLDIETRHLWHHNIQSGNVKKSPRSVTSSPSVSESDSDNESEIMTDSSSVHSSGTRPIAMVIPSDRLAPQFVTDNDWKSTLSSRRHSTAPIPNWSAALHESTGASARASLAMRPTWWEHPPQPNGTMGGFDPARHHPVFNVHVLNSSEGGSHPAATGYVNALVNHNPDMVLNRVP